MPSVLTGYIVPVRGEYTLTAKFGQAGSRWESGYHTGQDFAASIGVPVVASAGGLVTHISRSGPYGNRVEITHADGTITRYAHLNAISTNIFRPVSQGTVIGTVGNSGNVTGPHLHFEMLVNGKAVDPMPYLGSGRLPNLYVPGTETGPVPNESLDITAGSTWLRVAYFLAGGILIIIAIYFLIKRRLILL